MCDAPLQAGLIAVAGGLSGGGAALAAGGGLPVAVGVATAVVLAGEGATELTALPTVDGALARRSRDGAPEHA